MQVPDQAKLALLGACFAACLCTLFTTWSFEMDDRALPRLRPKNMSTWCAIPQEAWKACRNENNKEQAACQAEKLAVNQCEKSVQRAYRYINMGVCLHENQMVVLCNAEWCDPRTSNAAPGKCQEECAHVQQVLEDCIRKTVESYLPASAKAL